MSFTKIGTIYNEPKPAEECVWLQRTVDGCLFRLDKTEYPGQTSRSVNVPLGLVQGLRAAPALVPSPTLANGRQPALHEDHKLIDIFEIRSHGVSYGMFDNRDIAAAAYNADDASWTVTFQDDYVTCGYIAMHGFAECHWADSLKRRVSKLEDQGISRGPLDLSYSLSFSQIGALARLQGRLGDSQPMARDEIMYKVIQLGDDGSYTLTNRFNKEQITLSATQPGPVDVGISFKK